MLTEKDKSVLPDGKAVPINQLIDRVSSEPDIKMIFRGIPVESCGVVFGPAKSLKTTLVESLCLHIAAGINQFMGEPLYAPSRRVLLVSFEEFYRNRTKRNMKQIEYLNANNDLDSGWEENLFVVDDSFPRYLTNNEHWHQLEAEIERVKPSVLMLDSLTRMTADAIEDSIVATKVTRKLREITSKFNIAIIIIHHSQKIESRPLTLATLAGSRVVGQEMDFIIGVGRGYGNTRYLKDVAYRYAADDAENVLVFMSNEGQIAEHIKYASELDVLMPTSETQRHGLENKILEYFITVCQNDTSRAIPMSDLVNAFVKNQMMTKPTLYKLLKKLENNGLIIKVSHGLYSIVQVVNES